MEELIGEYGEFITPEAPAATASSNDLWLEFANEEEAQIAAEEIFPNVNVTSEVDGAVVHINGTPAALRRATTALQTNGLEVQVIDAPAAPAEEPAPVEESTEVKENTEKEIIKENVEVKNEEESEEDEIDSFLDVAARLTDYGSI